MGFTRERVGAGGKVRYAATYRDLKGRQRSAGKFSSRRKADRAWQRAEGKVAIDDQQHSMPRRRVSSER